MENDYLKKNINNSDGYLLKVLEGDLLTYIQENKYDGINIKQLYSQNNTFYTENNINFKIYSVGKTTSLHLVQNKIHL